MKRFLCKVSTRAVAVFFLFRYTEPEVSNMYPNIRALREDRDLSQRQVAEILGMSQTGYSKYETGENDIPTAVLIQLSTFYGTSVDYLLGLTPISSPYPR